MTREEIIERMGWMPTAEQSMSDIIARIEKIVRTAVEAEREKARAEFQLRHLIEANKQMLQTLTWLEAWLGSKPMPNCVQRIRDTIALVKSKPQVKEAQR